MSHFSFEPAVPTSGWSNVRLVPRVYIAPPVDGLWDFDFVANAPSGIAFQIFSPIVSAPFVAEVSEWFKGIRVHASINSATGSAEQNKAAKAGLTQLLAASLDGGGDVFPWSAKIDGGVDGFPWAVEKPAIEEVRELPTNETILQRTVESLLGMYVRVHRVSDPVTEDFRKNRINFVVTDDMPTLLRVYIG